MLKNQATVMEAARAIAVCRDQFIIYRGELREMSRDNTASLKDRAAASDLQAEIGLAVVKIHAETPSMLVAAIHGLLHHCFVRGLF